MKVIARQIQFVAVDLNVEYKTAITHWDSSLDIIVVTENNNMWNEYIYIAFGSNIYIWKYNDYKQ